MKCRILDKTRTETALVNGNPVQHTVRYGTAEVFNLTEKQVSDYRKAGKVVEPFDDTPQPETVTVLKADLAAAMKTVIADADKKTGEELKQAVEAVAKAEPIEAKP